MRRWAACYQQQGLVGLARKSRADRGKHRRCVPELVRLIEGLALQAPPPTAAFVHRQACSVATQHGWPLPSYDTVYEIIRGLDPGLRTLAQDGSKVYQEAFDLLYRREATRPNEMWQADHCLMDVWLLDPTDKPRQPGLTAILDDYSRRWLATCSVSRHPPDCRPPWLYDRPSGARPGRTGTSAVFLISSTPTTAAISSPDTWSK